MSNKIYTLKYGTKLIRKQSNRLCDGCYFNKENTTYDCLTMMADKEIPRCHHAGKSLIYKLIK